MPPLPEGAFCRYAPGFEVHQSGKSLLLPGRKQIRIRPTQLGISQGQTLISDSVMASCGDSSGGEERSFAFAAVGVRLGLRDGDAVSYDRT